MAERQRNGGNQALGLGFGIITEFDGIRPDQYMTTKVLGLTSSGLYRSGRCSKHWHSAGYRPVRNLPYIP